MISKLNKRRLMALSYFVLGWMSLSFAFVLLYNYTPLPYPRSTMICVALQFGWIMGMLHGIVEVRWAEKDRGNGSNWWYLAGRILVFSILIALSSLVVYASWHWENCSLMCATEMWSPYFKSPNFWAFFTYSLGSGFFLVFVFAVHKKLGRRTLTNSFLGIKQEPLEEERVFVFLDLRSATTIAETIGHLYYSNFLREYFHTVSNCCAENSGEVYQYAGDGVILTWLTSKCRRHPYPLYFLQDLIKIFAQRESHFSQKYQTTPRFKASLHAGLAIATEVGNFGSALAYHGDVLNTTARLQSLCNLLKQEYIVSDSFLQKMPHTEGFAVQSQGYFKMRGKEQDIAVYSLTPQYPLPKQKFKV